MTTKVGNKLINSEKVQLSHYFGKIYLKMLSIAQKATEPAPKIVGFASRRPGEGVSTIAEAFSLYLASNEQKKILFVQAASYEKLLCPPFTSGSDKQLKEDTIADRIIPHEQYEFDVIMLDKKILKNIQKGTVFNRIADHYDHIIIDAANFDTKFPYLFSHLIDFFILVVDAATTTTYALNIFASELVTSDVAFKAFILNKRRYWIPQIIYNHFL